MGKETDVSRKRSDKHTEILQLLYYGELTPGGSKGHKKQHPARMCSRQAERQPWPLIMKLYKRDWQPGEGSQSRSSVSRRQRNTSELLSCTVIYTSGEGRQPAAAQ